MSLPSRRAEPPGRLLCPRVSSIADSFTESVSVNGRANNLLELNTVLKSILQGTAGPGLSINRAIMDRDLQLKFVRGDALPALLHAHVAAHGRAPFVKAGAFIEHKGTDHHSVAFPLARRVSGLI